MSKKKQNSIKYESHPVGKTTKPGIVPNRKKLPKIGSGRNRATQRFNQITKKWSRQR